MKVSIRLIVGFSLVSIGSAAHAADTAGGKVTAWSDKQAKFTATGILSYRDTDSDGNIDSPPFPVEKEGVVRNWRFEVQHLVKDWKIGNVRKANGADDFQLRISGRHIDGPHEAPEKTIDTDPNPLAAKTSSTFDIGFGRTALVIAGGRAAHRTNHRTHSDNYWVRSPITPSRDPTGGVQHLTAGSFDVRAWHNKKSRTQHPNWMAMASSPDADSTLEFDADSGTLRFRIGHVDGLDGVGGTSGSVEPWYGNDPVQGAHWMASELQLQGQDPEGRFQFGPGNMELFDPSGNFQLTAHFPEMLIGNQPDPFLPIGVGVFDSMSMNDLDQDQFSQSQFLRDFADQNLFALGIPDEQAALSQGVGFSVMMPRNLVELTNGFSESVFDIPATFLLSGLIGEPTDDHHTLAGDLDNDGFVGESDLNLVLFNWDSDAIPAEWINHRPTPGSIVGAAQLNAVLFTIDRRCSCS